MNHRDQLTWASFPQVEKNQFHDWAATMFPAGKSTIGGESAIDFMLWESLSEADKGEVLNYMTAILPARHDFSTISAPHQTLQ